MMRYLSNVLFVLLFSAPAMAAIRVSPEGVNVHGQGATTVFLTYGGLDGYVPAEAMWCGELTAAPDNTLVCDPATIYGRLPARYDWSRSSGSSALTDIMSVPPSVTRRAYQAAAAGRSAEFFYIRRFVSPGEPDQYVRVTCRLTGGGARVPLSIVDVRLAFDIDVPVFQVRAGERVPKIEAHLQYTGTGRLRGRWEVVLPGEEVPDDQDLLTEATLPIELRSSQKRYATIERFNVFLPPTGRYTLAGPDSARLPTNVNGQHLVLLRIEESDDREADSDLSAIGAGPGVVHAGGVAGFPMPSLRYVVSAGETEAAPVTNRMLGQVTGGGASPADSSVEFRWSPVVGARYYRLELERARDRIHQAFVNAAATSYTLPPFVKDKANGGDMRWRVVAIDAAGSNIGQTEWRLVVGRR
jgi:hypothetical protein